MLRTTGRRIGASIAALALALAAAPAAQAEPELTELKVEAAFDKASYVAGSMIALRVSISNIGTLPAEKVVIATDGGNFYPNDSGWGELAYDRGALIEPGTTRTFEVTGFIGQVSDSVTIKGRALSPSVGPVYEPQFDLRSEIRATTGGWTGVVYGDRNENDQIDPGEPLGGTTVRLQGGVPYSNFETTTRPDGTFTFSQIPTGRYSSSSTAPDGWITPFDGFFIDEGPARESAIRALRPLSDRLKASITLKKKTYQPGEAVQIRVTLTNRGSTPLTGIKAWCNRIGDSNQMSTSPNWGLLHWDALGLTIAAGETKTVNITDEMPAGARDWGEVVVACDFGPNDSSSGYPAPFATARVPGILGGAYVNVVQRDTPVAGVQVLLVDRYTKRIVERRVSDANGQFSVRDRQVGPYDVIVLGAWKLEYPGAHIRLWAHNGPQWISVVPR